MQQRIFSLIVFVFCALAAKGQAPPCSMTVSTDHGCIPLPVQFAFTSTNSSPIVSYDWNFGDGDSSSQASASHIYRAAGAYHAYVTVTFKDGTTCTVNLSKPIVVYTNPVPSFTVNHNRPVLLCRRGDSICFQDFSTPGLDKAPIKSWLWTFGDGESSTHQNPCYAYSDSGNYQVTEQVTDTNGCTQYLQKVVSIRYTTDLGINTNPSFKIFISYDCRKNADFVKFTNETDTTGQFITEFIWNFGDGTGDTCNLLNSGCLANWTNFTHEYSKSGTYNPYLFIENAYGCSNSVQLDTPIAIKAYKLAVSVFPDRPSCFNIDSEAEYSVPPDSQARGYVWDFGDPYKRDPGALAATAHIYKMPGTYTIHVEVQIGTCLYDSTVCHAVTFNGPIALIMPVKGSVGAWDVVPASGSYLIPTSDYKNYFDTSCTGPPLVTYYTYKPTLIKNGEPVYDSCRIDTIITPQPGDSLWTCGNKKVLNVLTSYQRHIDSYKDTTEDIATKHIWFKGDPDPPGNVYSDSPFVNRPLYMDDTSLFSLRCSAPQLVKFTNFSIKYRGYFAVDNYPMAFPDKCLNKAYPYASDSLQYNWDFGEGAISTSSPQNPVDIDRYSTEKLPEHLYRVGGCYWAKLIVSDTITGCSDIDSVPVVLEHPSAGWEYPNIKNMTSVGQDTLPGKGPRRGMIIGRPPCQGDTQIIDLSETLPSCYKVDYSMILDSAASTMVCNHDVSHTWLHKSYIEDTLNSEFIYEDTGWVTVGLVMRNNANCTDTVWYHDYKYIHGTYPAINVSAKIMCVGDTLKMTPLMPKQLGIQTFVYYLYEIGDPGDTFARYKPDTVAYKLVKRKNGGTDTITSTVHNKLWGIDDGALNFDNLTDTLALPINKIGHFFIKTVIISRFGCVDTAKTEVMVGHYADFNVDNTVVCTNDVVHFQGLAQYLVPFTKNPFGYDLTNYWANPDSARGGRKPLHPETMQWDFNGDGIVDATGVNVWHIYNKPGVYTINYYTTDSNLCTQILVKKSFMTVIGDSAYFAIDSPGDTRYCAGSHFFQFVDSSHVIKPFKDSLNTYHIYSWTWDFGDGTPALTITDSAKKNASHIYLRNGDDTVTLIVRTSPGTGVNGQGCADTFRRVVHILGPIADFKVIGPVKGCVPFTLEVRDLSKEAKIREWRLGDGTVVTSSGQDTVYLTYQRPGTFCPQFYVTATVIDAQGDTLYCDDSFPTKCAIKVTVYDTNKQVLTASDTLLCVNRDSVYFQSAPDTGYNSWTIHYGNGDTANSLIPRFGYIYNKIGKYHVTVNGYGAKCPDTASINVRVIDIKSLFSIDTAKNDTPTFSFKNLAVGGVRYVWNWGDGTDSTGTTSTSEISHTFMKAGKSTICLSAYNKKGCVDKYCEDINIDTFLFVPNVFTPNGDGYNSTFDIIIYGNLAYHLNIYNRWGQQVFESNNKNQQWDGTDKASGRIYPSGTYYYVFSYRFIGNKSESREGAVTLIRN